MASNPSLSTTSSIGSHTPSQRNDKQSVNCSQDAPIAHFEEHAAGGCEVSEDSLDAASVGGCSVVEPPQTDDEAAPGSVVSVSGALRSTSDEWPNTSLVEVDSSATGAELEVDAVIAADEAVVGEFELVGDGTVDGVTEVSDSELGVSEVAPTAAEPRRAASRSPAG